VVSRRTFILAAAGFTILILIAVGLGLLLRPDKAPAMNVPTPPGMTELSGVLRDMQEKGIEKNFKNGKLVAYSMNNGNNDILVAFSFDSSHYNNVPPEDAGLEEMEAWVKENGEAISKDFTDDFAMLMDTDANLVKLQSLEALETASGDVTIHIDLNYLDQRNRLQAGLNTLIFSKKHTIYMIFLITFDGGTEAVIMDHLKQNISFK
jgi:hypothetical protein